jgi:hypothetical protein
MWQRVFKGEYEVFPHPEEAGRRTNAVTNNVIRKGGDIDSFGTKRKRAGLINRIGLGLIAAAVVLLLGIWSTAPTPSSYVQLRSAHKELPGVFLEHSQHGRRGPEF